MQITWSNFEEALKVLAASPKHEGYRALRDFVSAEYVADRISETLKDKLQGRIENAYDGRLEE